MTLAQNPLLAPGLPRFDRVTAAHVAPAIDDLLARCESARQQVLQPDAAPDFETLSERMDPPLQALEAAWGVVTHLQAVGDTPALRAAVADNQPKVTAFFSSLSCDLRLYGLYKRVAASQGETLSPAQRRALEHRLRGFRLSGAELDGAAKARFTATQLRCAALAREFSNRLLDATDAFVHWASAEELEGVPAEVLDGLAAAARADGRAEGFKVTLQQPCFGPLMQYARRRDLREMLYRAFVTRASEFGPTGLDNGPVVREILALRHERAALLGHPHHAAVSLIPKMAESPEQVLAFLRDLGHRSRPQAVKELEELRAFARDSLGMDSLQAWDVGYAAERLRQARYAFSDQEVREHFQLDKVLSGLFRIAEALFDITLRPDTPPVWHPSVSACRVERGGVLLGHFYLDPFARAGKRSGAWMSGAQPRWRRPDGSVRTAMAHLVTNFAAPVAGRPALLRHDEVVTLFHEFGHAMHFLLSQIDVLGVSGISGVEWDAVELPSQLMENFAWQWPLVERLSAQVDTGAPLPRPLFDKMTAARNFQQGMALLRQVEMSVFDMRLHSEPGRAGDSQSLIDEVRAEYAVVMPPACSRSHLGFSHIFAGGYAAGYYSYLWAEVLACDAWGVFEQAGGLAPSVGRHYREAILEVGGSRPMQESFEAFVGRPPRIDALLRQRGLAAAPA